MDSVKILGLTYTIERVTLITRYEDLVGKIDTVAQKILIDEAISAEREKIVLLHEVLHGILAGLGYYEESNNETLVQNLAIALHQCSKDNPGLF